MRSALRKQAGRIRLLPLTLVAAALVFTVKLGEVWDGLGALRAPVALAQSAASEAPAVAQAAAAVRQEPAEPPIPVLPADERGLSKTEIELLQKLAERREALDGRERELDMREGLLRAAEERLTAKAGELEGLQQRIEALVRKHDEQQEAKLVSLVSIYEKMKPKEAAAILGGLDMAILVDVLGRMKEMKTAPILAAMDPEKAREVTARLAERDPPLGG